MAADMMIIICMAGRYKRLGAAMAFRQVLRHIREETALKRLYLLELLDTALWSLRAAHGDMKGFGTVELFSRVIEGIVKVGRWL
jgi:hypothetical protein